MSASVADRTSARRPRGRWKQSLTQSAPLLLAVAILAGLTVLYVALFDAQLGRLPGLFEWTSVVNSGMPTALVAIGQSIVVLTRGIDLSVGGIVDVSNSLAATHMHPGAASMLGWSLIILLFGTAAGAINGALIAYARLQPILVTLATLSILQGVALDILPTPGGSIPTTYSDVLANPNRPWGLVAIGAVVVLWFVFRRTSLGVRIYAIGNDEYAARAHGIPVRRVKVAAYALSGLLSSAGGLFLAASTTAGDATEGNTFVLTSIAAVVLGGVSFQGGRGSALGALTGAFILTVLVNVLFFAQINPLYQSFFQGLFLVVAVLLGALLGRLLKRSNA
jgi:ribose transport system permease protein